MASSGCFPHQDVGQQQLAELFHDDFSLFWPLTALLGYLFFLSQKNMLVLSCCIFQSSMTMVSGLAACLCVCECVEESMCVHLPDPTPYGLFLYNMNVDLQSVYSDLCSVSSHSGASCSCRA